MEFSDETVIQKAIKATLEHLDVLQKHSVNRFDQPEVYNRAFQLIDVLDAKVHDLNHIFEVSDPDVNRILQNLLFNVKRMRESAESLRYEPHQLNFQQDLIKEIDQIKESLNKLI
ncbi:MAG: hypothetical protein K1000chlam2_00351 [Chlamydiae bacterium]|nr:hypothetical protein [Chlamydiota bacterium]